MQDSAKKFLLFLLGLLGTVFCGMAGHTLRVEPSWARFLVYLIPGSIMFFVAVFCWPKESSTSH